MECQRTVNGNTESCAFLLFSAIINCLRGAGCGKDEIGRWKFEIDSEGFVSVFRLWGSLQMYEEFGEKFFRENLIPMGTWQKAERSWGGIWNILPDGVAKNGSYNNLGWRYKKSIFNTEPPVRPLFPGDDI